MRKVLSLVLSLACVPLAIAADTGPAGPTAAAPAALPALDRAAIRKELTDMSIEGISRRLGPDYSAYTHEETEEAFPDVYLAPKKDMRWGPKKWQIGPAPTPKAGDYSSSQGQMLYVPTDPGKNFGCDRVTVSEWTNGVFTESPEPPWHDKFRPDPMVAKWKETAGDIGQPIACGRGYGGWCNLGMVLHSSGFIGASGTSTAPSFNAHISIPPEKIATNIALTNKNELALVTVHDTTTGKGQVAVIMVTATGVTPEGKTHFVHEWTAEYPGLFNVGMIKGFKLLGYIDLPGIDFPTSVSAMGNSNQARIEGRSGNAGPINEWDIRNPADRKTFYKGGGNAGLSSTAGWAMVAGKYENKVAFIDMQAIFETVREYYFTTDEKFAVTRKLGPGELWPPTFEAKPEWKPVVVKVVDVNRPTAVIGSLVGGAKAIALVASEDGTLTTFSTGGLGSPEAVDADAIKPTGTGKMGRNPTCLTYSKGPNDTFIASSRGDREIVWIKCGATGPVVNMRLRDKRLLDPVNVEKADTHGAEYTLITVADFKGKQIVNYRHGTITFATQGGAKYGCGPEGKDEWECGGTMDFPGHPFVVSATNVN